VKRDSVQQQQTPTQTPKQLQTKVLKQNTAILDAKKRLTSTQTSQPKHSFKTSYSAATQSTAKRSSGSQEAPQLLGHAPQQSLSSNPFAELLESDLHRSGKFGRLLEGMIEESNFEGSSEKASKPSHKMVTRSQKQS